MPSLQEVMEALPSTGGADLDTLLVVSGGTLKCISRSDLRGPVVLQEEAFRTAASFQIFPTPPAPDGTPSTTLTDYTTQLEEARDWSIASGGMVLFPAGYIGFTGPFKLKSHMSFQGAGREKTIFYNLATDQSDGFTSLLPDEDANVDGACFVHLRDLSISCGWDKTGSGGAWNYPRAEMTQVGLRLHTPISSTAVRNLNRFNKNDTYNIIQNVGVTNVAGVGMWLDGRGEMMLDSLNFESCAIGGMYCGSPDNWISNVTSHGHGFWGTWVTAGNLRGGFWKSWFIGLNKYEKPDQGHVFEGSGNKNVDLVAITAQDCWGAGIRWDFAGSKVTGNLDECGGGRLYQDGYGYRGARSNEDNCYILIGSADFSVIEMSLANVIANGFTVRVAHCDGSGHENTDVLYHLDANAAQISETVTADGGSTNNKRHIQVRRKDGSIIYGYRTIAELNDETHGVNLHKQLGSVAILDDGRPVYSSGGPSASWVDATGTVVATPTTPV